jgi:hypothetical protein
VTSIDRKDPYAATRRLLAGLLLTLAPAAPQALAQEVTIYKTPTCGCCVRWAEHMEENGFSVTLHNHADLRPFKQRFGVPASLQSCHTAEVEGYAIEGHVPAADVRRLLEERPDAAGLAVPGMPVGSPGMEMGDRRDPYQVILFGDDEPAVYASH